MYAPCGQQQLAHGAARPAGPLGASLVKARLNQVKAGTLGKPDTGLLGSIGQEQGFRGAGAGAPSKPDWWIWLWWQRRKWHC